MVALPSCFFSRLGGYVYRRVMSCSCYHWNVSRTRWRARDYSHELSIHLSIFRPSIGSRPMWKVREESKARQRVFEHAIIFLREAYSGSGLGSSASCRVTVYSRIYLGRQIHHRYIIPHHFLLACRPYPWDINKRIYFFTSLVPSNATPKLSRESSPSK